MSLQIGIVGGHGQMGRWLAAFFTQAGAVVRLADLDTSLTKEMLARDSDVLLVAVPLGLTLRCIEELLPHLKKDALLVDVASVKSQLKTVYERCPCAVLSLHPLFGPHVPDMRGQVVTVSELAASPKSTEVQQMLEQSGAELVRCDIDEHDRIMAVIQGLTHFSAISAANCMRELGVDIVKSLTFASPIYRLRLDMLGRILAQDARLYAEIEALNPYVGPVLEAYEKSVQELKSAVQNSDIARFEEIFRGAQRHFSGFAETALRESNELISLLSREKVKAKS